MYTVDILNIITLLFFYLANTFDLNNYELTCTIKSSLLLLLFKLIPVFKKQQNMF